MMKTGLIALVFAALFSAAPAQAQKVPGELGRQAVESFQGLADEFGLTGQQRAQIRRILIDAVPDVMAVGSEMAANRSELQSVIAQTELDTAAVDAIAIEQGHLFSQLVIINAQTTHQVRAVLTDEQLAMVEEIKALIRDRILALANSF